MNENDARQQTTAKEDSAAHRQTMVGQAASEPAGSAQTFSDSPGRSDGLRLLVVTAVEAEAEAVRRGLGGAPGCDVIAAGAGPAAAAAGAAAALAAGRYGCVISAGIAGGFPGAPLGSLVLASELVAADLGAETPEGFRSAAELGFGRVSLPSDPGRTAALAAALAAAGLPVSTGAVLTVATATGSAETAAGLAARVPGAAAEAMEGFGVAEAAARFGVAALELRAVSNAVGPRDRAAWKIPEALDMLSRAFAVVPQALL